MLFKVQLHLASVCLPTLPWLPCRWGGAIVTLVLTELNRNAATMMTTTANTLSISSNKYDNADDDDDDSSDP